MKAQTRLRICAVTSEPSFLAYTKYRSRGRLRPNIRHDNKNENVLLYDKESHSVHLVTRDSKEVREFLTEKDGLYQPYTTSFRRSDGTLVVTCRDLNNILVFILK